MRVMPVTRGEAALRELEEARADPFDVCIIDIMMPGMDGYEVARRIRGQFGSIPLLAFSSSVAPGALKSQEAGFDAFLSKPVRRERLFQVLGQLIGGAGTSGQAGDPPAERSSTDGGQPVRILLVEDNPVNQSLATIMLNKGGCQVEVAENGKEAVERFTATPDMFDLIFMDVQMPRMDGLEATRKIRQIEQLRDLPKSAAPTIIAMTANALQGDRERCLAAGMNDYLSKPIRSREIQGMIEKWGKARRQPTAEAATPTPEPFVQCRDKAPVPTDSDPVDLNRMLELADEDPKNLKELFDIFQTQTDPCSRN